MVDKEIEGFIREVGGEDSVNLVGYLFGKENVNEFKLAEKLGISVNQVRNILYRLQEYNLVKSTRKKDKKKGWYIYYWTFNKKQALNEMLAYKQRRLEVLKKKLEEESTMSFFTCANKCLRMEFSEAMEHNFKCPECGKLMEKQDNKKQMILIKKELFEIEQKVKKGKKL
jgi:transcription initiation factor TFIIE subunit alpha